MTNEPVSKVDDSVKRKTGLDLPRNVWAVSLTSFFMDISSEMVLNLLPLYLSNVLGVRTNLIGLIEGVAESTASLIKLFSGWVSDKLQARKWLAVGGYGLSAISKPFFLLAGSWWVVALVRWSDRVGKGVRTAPRDALIADSIQPERRGIAFGVQRAADTAGALLGLLIAWGVTTWFTGDGVLDAQTFQIIIWISLLPAGLAVLSLALGAKDVPIHGVRSLPRVQLRGLGRPFALFLLATAIFELGNASDAFLVLRAQERGVSVGGIMAMLVLFNLVYTLISGPAGALADRIGKRRLVLAGWGLYALVYAGFALAQETWHIGVLYGLYGLYYGAAYGVSKALVADFVPAGLRGTAFGTYNATLGIMDLPASLIAGFLWQGMGNWQGFGASAPFWFGAVMASLGLLILWRLTPDEVVVDKE